jgi:hypothetical protein
LTGATAADAPPTSEKVNPAAPSAGTAAFVTRFRFEVCFTSGIVASPSHCEKDLVQHANCTATVLGPQGDDHMDARRWHADFEDFMFMNGVGAAVYS